jgi:hypothetical protein
LPSRRSGVIVSKFQETTTRLRVWSLRPISTSQTVVPSEFYTWTLLKIDSVTCAKHLFKRDVGSRDPSIPQQTDPKQQSSHHPVTLRSTPLHRPQLGIFITGNCRPHEAADCPASNPLKRHLGRQSSSAPRAPQTQTPQSTSDLCQQDPDDENV